MIDFKKPIMYIYVGCARSGKTTFFNKYHKHFCDCVSRDLIREFWFGDKSNMRNEGKVTEIFNTKLDLYLYLRKNIVIDNTNLLKKYRKEFIKKAKDNGYNIVCIMFSTTKQTILERAIRSDFPANVIEKMLNNIEIPSVEEGFDNIINIMEEK